jgi:predicted ATPase
MLVLAQHHLGQHAEAAALATLVMDYHPNARHRHLSGPVPRGVSMRVVKARTLWLQGHVDQAVEVAHEAARYADGQHPFALCQALALAVIPIALWRGDGQRAREGIERLSAHATQHSLPYWLSWVNGYRQVLWLQAHPSTPNNRAHRLEEPWVMPSSPLELDMLSTHSMELLTQQSVARVNSGMVGWNAPEVLRASAEKMLRDAQGLDATSTDALSTAELQLLRALQLAKEQNALSWELRTASSLARLGFTQGRAPDALHLLAAVRARFTEGFESLDLREADRLLTAGQGAKLRQPPPQRSPRRA